MKCTDKKPAFIVLSIFFASASMISVNPLSVYAADDDMLQQKDYSHLGKETLEQTLKEYDVVIIKYKEEHKDAARRYEVVERQIKEFRAEEDAIRARKGPVDRMWNRLFPHETQRVRQQNIEFLEKRRTELWNDMAVINRKLTHYRYERFQVWKRLSLPETVAEPAPEESVPWPIRVHVKTGEDKKVRDPQRIVKPTPPKLLPPTTQTVSNDKDPKKVVQPRAPRLPQPTSQTASKHKDPTKIVQPQPPKLPQPTSRTVKKGDKGPSKDVPQFVKKSDVKAAKGAAAGSGSQQLPGKLAQKSPRPKFVGKSATAPAGTVTAKSKKPVSKRDEYEIKSSAIETEQVTHNNKTYEKLIHTEAAAIILRMRGKDYIVDGMEAVQVLIEKGHLVHMPGIGLVTTRKFELIDVHASSSAHSSVHPPGSSSRPSGYTGGGYKTVKSSSCDDYAKCSSQLGSKLFDKTLKKNNREVYWQAIMCNEKKRNCEADKRAAMGESRIDEDWDARRTTTEMSDRDAQLFGQGAGPQDRRGQQGSSWKDRWGKSVEMTEEDATLFGETIRKDK